MWIDLEHEYFQDARPGYPGQGVERWRLARLRDSLGRVIQLNYGTEGEDLDRLWLITMFPERPKQQQFRISYDAAGVADEIAFSPPLLDAQRRRQPEQRQPRHHGVLAGRIAYDPFGRVRVTEGEQTRLAFTGEYRDTAGLIWLRAPHYAPVLGPLPAARHRGRRPGQPADAQPLRLRREQPAIERRPHRAYRWVPCNSGSSGKSVGRILSERTGSRENRRRKVQNAPGGVLHPAGPRTPSHRSNSGPVQGQASFARRFVPLDLARTRAPRPIWAEGRPFGPTPGRGSHLSTDGRRVDPAA
jgi:hypothetical protein